MKKVIVLMSTYNGERFLKEQLDSVLRQRDVEVRIVVRDDGSTDDTIKILREYEKKYQNIDLLCDGENLGVTRSFLKLVSEYTDGEYFALCDQDDVWDENKLFVAVEQLEKMKDGTPRLYFSNLKVTDESLNVCRMFYSQKPKINNKYSCLIETYATGCTVVYNNELARIAKKTNPRNFSMHDTWLFDVASLLGETFYDNAAYINYRQHENNVIGSPVKKSKMKQIFNGVNRLSKKNIHPYSDNAEILYGELYNDLDEISREKLWLLANYRKAFIYKISLIFDKHLYTNSFIRNLKFRILVLLGLA